MLASLRTRHGPSPYSESPAWRGPSPSMPLTSQRRSSQIKPDQAKAWMKGLGDNDEDKGKVLRRQIEEFLESLGESSASAGRLKDAWSLFRRPFYLQGLVLLGMASSIAYTIQT